MIVNMDVRSHNTRVKTNIAVARCKYNVANHSLLQEGITLYNALFISFRELPYNTFKRDPKKFLINKLLHTVEEFYA